MPGLLSISRWLFLLAMCLPDSKAIINEEVKIIKYPDKGDPQSRQEKADDDLDSIPRHFSSPLDKCTYKVHHVLGSLSKRRSSSVDTSTVDLSGYALHQTLRSAPYDMYITNMRIRLPYHKQGYIQVDKCRYDDLHKLLQTNMLFRDLTITGNIQLYSDQQLGNSLLRRLVEKRTIEVEKPSNVVSNRSELGKRKLLHRQTEGGAGHFRRYTADRRIKPSGGEQRSFQTDQQWNIEEIDENDQLRKTLFDHLINYNHYYNAGNTRYHLPRPVENCNMTLKLKSVGLGFSAIPERVVETDYSRNINIKTTATYLEPNYVSIHAYNCKNILANGSAYRKNGFDGGTVDGMHVYKRTDDAVEDDLESEMEQVFIKGSRSLLTNYMEKQFKNVLRDSLMTNLGYTVSYGRKR